MAKHDLWLLSGSVILIAGAIRLVPMVGVAPPTQIVAVPDQISLEVTSTEASDRVSVERQTTANAAPIIRHTLKESEPELSQDSTKEAPKVALVEEPPSVQSNTHDVLPADMPIDLASVKELMRQRNFAGAAAMLASPELGDDPEALYLLSNLYRKGQGVEFDLERAFTFVQAAAERGHLEAQFSLGRMYLSGKGTHKDTNAAQLWMARAAEGGHVGATEALVVLITQMTSPSNEAPVAEPEVQVAGSAIAERMGLSPLMEAASRGELRAVSQLIDGGTEIDERDPEGRTPLMLASVSGQTDVVSRLLESGARPDATDRDGMTAIMHAARAGQTKAMELLLAGGSETLGLNNLGQSLSEIALAAGHCGAAAFAINNASDFAPAMEAGALTAAIGDCGQEEFIQLADAGIDLNFKDARGRDGLWYAAQQGKPLIVQFYLGDGSDPNITDVAGLSALLVAINGAQEQIAVDLIEAGAQIDSETKSGNTPLLIAATRGLDATALVLIDRGADINHRNRDGYTALMLAAKYGRGELAETLIAHNADADLRNVKRERASDIALAAGYQEIAILMD